MECAISLYLSSGRFLKVKLEKKHNFQSVFFEKAVCNKDILTHLHQKNWVMLSPLEMKKSNNDYSHNNLSRNKGNVWAHLKKVE